MSRTPMAQSVAQTCARTFALLVAVGSVGLAAAPGTAMAANAPNACKVLRASEVALATGFPAKKAATQPQAPPRAAVCAYTLGDTAASTVSVFVQPDAGQLATRGYAAARKQFVDTLEPVAGFGKRAFYVGGGMDTLYVLKGDTFFSVQYAAQGVDDPTVIKPIVETMGKKAAARL